LILMLGVTLWGRADSAFAQAIAPAAGAIRGRVVDAHTGAGVAKVLVLVEGGGPSTVSNDEGYFRLLAVPAGSRRLFVSVVGYILVRRDVEVAPEVEADLTIALTEGTGTYTETVTVAADRFRQAETAVASQQVLGSAEIQNLRGVLADDPLRAVQVLPGVATGDDLRSEFSVRGSAFSHMNMTVDGFTTPFLLHTVRAIEDHSASGSVAMINSDILEDVTLLNGAYAQRYGDRTGAELDFRLREGSREGRHARFAVSGTNASAVAEGPIGGTRKGSWIVSARQSYLDFLLQRLYGDRAQGVTFGFADAQAKVVFDVTPAQHVELTIIAGHSKLGERRDDLDTTDAFVARNSSALAIGTWRYTRSRGVLTARALASVNRFRNDLPGTVTLDAGRDTQGAARVDGSVAVRPSLQVDAGLQGDWTEETRERQRFTAGRYRLVNDFSGAALRAGGYGEMRWTAGRLTLVPGARADRWTLTGETTGSPWLQAEWRAARSVSIRGGAGIYRQFPDFENVIGTLGRPDARAQRATQFDLGVEHRFGTTMRWQITGYDRQERGFFRRAGAEPRIVGGAAVRGSTQTPYRGSVDGYARGVELLLQRKSVNGVSGWVSYAFGRNRYEDTATGESYWGDLDQRHTLNVYMFYRMSPRTSVSGKFRVGSNTPAPGYYTPRGAEYFLSATRNDVRLPVYSRLDLRANRTFNWSRRRLTVFAEVVNVADRDNRRFNPPGVNFSTGRVSTIFESMVPIVPSAGLLIEF
jgi:hypothetical protein